MAESDKSHTKINVLMNISSYYGEHQSRFGPIVKFLLISCVPLAAYIFLLIGVVPFKYVLIFEVPFVIRVALKTIGREDEKFAAYMASREDEYANADDLVRIPVIHDDGLIEYDNGVVAYIVSAYTTTYFEDDNLADDLEKFIRQLCQYVYDMHVHMVVDEFRLQNKLDKMAVYTDRELMRERVGFYVHQDEVSTGNSQLYRINFLFKASKYQWKALKADLNNAMLSTYAAVFKKCFVCDREQVVDVISRDLYAYVDLGEMMKKRFKNDEYYGSKVYYYGDSVPNEYEQERDNIDLEGRRVVE